MNAKEYLLKQLEKEQKDYIGYTNMEVINFNADAWMNDDDNSKHRFEIIKKFFPEAYVILDMASGCGTCVFYGLLNGYDMYGIDPEKWKHTFNRLKAVEKGYPEEWFKKFYIGVGENLPFINNYFDFCTTYQTLEHVMDPKKCILEMLRVTRVGGGIHIMCPDYRSTYEGHYNLPWLPLFPPSFAKIYLKKLGRSVRCLDMIKYITTKRILKWIKEIAEEKDWQVKIVNVNKHNFNAAMIKRKFPIIPGSYLFFQTIKYIKYIFRSELQTNLIIRIIHK